MSAREISIKLYHTNEHPCGYYRDRLAHEGKGGLGVEDVLEGFGVVGRALEALDDEFLGSHVHLAGGHDRPHRLGLEVRCAAIPELG